MKKINIKLTIPELQALAVISADEWIRKKEEFSNPLHTKTSLDNNILKNWKNLSEKLFKIYRINNKKYGIYNK